MGERIPEALRRVAAEARTALVACTGDPSLAKRCIPASLYLQARARAAGFELDVVGGVVKRPRKPWGEGHVWCALGGWRIDLTATQYWSVPGVYVTAAEHERYGTVFYRGLEVLGNDVQWKETARLLRDLGVVGLAVGGGRG